MTGVRLAVLAMMVIGRAALAQEDGGLVRNGNDIFVPENSPYRRAIKTALVEQQPQIASRDVPATVEADPTRTFAVLPALGGRIVEVDVNLGQRVTAGQKLAVIDSGDLAQAISDVEKAAAQAKLAAQALARARGVAHAGGNATKDVESAENDFAQAQSEWGRAQTRLRALTGSNHIDGVRKLIVTAPADGYVTSLVMAPGLIINDPTQTIMTINNLDPVFVTASVAEQDLSFVAPGQQADIIFSAYPQQKIATTVASVNAVMEPDTLRVKTRLILRNPRGQWRPNMFATVIFKHPPAMEVVVPNAALLMNNDSTTVFVQTSPWHFTRRDVQTGFDTNGLTTILGGLRAGETIIVVGGVLLNG